MRNEQRWDTVLQQLAAGENVILLANHQSEADAAFIPLMTMASHPTIGEKVIYVAGDRVTSDLMAKVSALRAACSPRALNDLRVPPSPSAFRHLQPSPLRAVLLVAG